MPWAMEVDEHTQAPPPPPPAEAGTAAESPDSDEFRAASLSRSRLRREGRRRRRDDGVGRGGGLDDLGGLKEALRSVLKEVNVGTRRNLEKLDLRVQNMQDEVGRLPDLVADGVACELTRLGPTASSAARGHGSHSGGVFVPGTVMLRCGLVTGTLRARRQRLRWRRCGTWCR